VSGLWALQYLVDEGTIDRPIEQAMYTMVLASAFRSIRFGITRRRTAAGSRSSSTT
jgi:hypothetical protein